MAPFKWRPFLEQYSRELLADRQLRKRVPEAVLQSGWMGFEPALPDQIAELEDRIGVALPQSYKQFFATSNGWRESGGFIYEMWPCAKVEWFHISNQDWIDAYVEAAKDAEPLPVSEHCVYGPNQNPCIFRAEFLQSALLISDIGDSAVYLLNPEIKTAAGEWEAWFFANWAPGATRYRSFWDLMQEERRSFVNLRDHDETRYFAEDGVETLPDKLPGLVGELADKAKSHRMGQEQRASRSESSFEAYTDGIVGALDAAEARTKGLASLGLSPEATLNRLIALAEELEHQWKSTCRPNACGVDERAGRAEGNREAAGIIRWFLNQM